MPTAHGSIRSIFSEFSGYLFALLLCLALVCWLYNLPGRDLSVPFSYDGDALEVQLFSRGAIDQGWPLTFPRYGAPYQFSMHDFQHSANLQYLMLSLLALTGSSDPLLLTNLYYLALFPLTTLFALLVLRQIGLTYWPALVAALLYSFLPFRHLRGISHLWLSGYYLVPLAVLLLVWVWQQRPLWSGGRPTRVGWLGSLIVVMVGSAEVYNAFFACFFLMVAGLTLALRQRSWRAMGPSVALCGLFLVTVLVNLSPQFVNNFVHGANVEGYRRGLGDAQAFDLRISQLLLPVTGHRLAPLAQLKEGFNSRLVLLNENDAVTLGLLGGIGLLYLLLTLFRSGQFSDDSSILEGISKLNLAALLLATMGSFGMMLNWIFPFIRCYNRISVYIAFFSLIALAFLLQFLLTSLARWSVRRVLGVSLCLMLAILGAWDQTPASTAQVSKEISQRLAGDRAFVRYLEERLPPESKLFQFPHRFFPEGGDYSHLRLSLHTSAFHWSYPSMRGRLADLWQRAASDLPPGEFLDRLCWAGFAGICIDRWNLSPVDQRRLKHLHKLLGPAEKTTPDGRFAYHDLTSRALALRSRLTPAEIEQQQQAALQPVLLQWGKGFQLLDQPRQDEGRWGNSRAELLLHNTSSQSQVVDIEWRLCTGPRGGGTLTVTGPELHQDLSIDPQPRTSRFRMTVPPGRTRVQLHCDAPGVPGKERRRFCVLEHRVIGTGSGEVAHER